MSKETFGAPALFPDGTRAPFSQAVRAGGFLFVAGQLGVDAGFRLVGEDIESQTRQALANIEARLREGGGRLADVVKVTAYLTHPEDFAAYNRVYAGVFADNPPARTTVVAALLLAGARVEIEAIAVVEGT
jgi:2-iminobutanoate/2-iminopropanoate deaminase